jgi:hypothetical protein
MTTPTALDRDFHGSSAAGLMKGARRDDGIWAIASLGEVQGNLSEIGYPGSLLHFVQGRVEDTIPAQAPGRIALLRLDTDWYESTAHELAHLYCRLVSGGVLIIDDYGHWQGARRAVDEFFGQLDRPPYLHRIDFSGRLVVKP